MYRKPAIPFWDTYERTHRLGQITAKLRFVACYELYFNHLFGNPMGIISRLYHACVAYLTKTLDLMTLGGRFCNMVSIPRRASRHWGIAQRVSPLFCFLFRMGGRHTDERLALACV